MNITRFYDPADRRIKITRIKMMPIYDLQIQNDGYLLVIEVRFIRSIWMLMVLVSGRFRSGLVVIWLLFCSSCIFI